MLSKTLNFVSAEVLEVISDTEARLKKEFGKEGGKGTSKILERLKEISAPGLSYKIVPYVDQQEMYMHVYEKLKSGGCVGIFPEGAVSPLHFVSISSTETGFVQAVATIGPISCLLRLV
jgi:glycerol-3-phosphate O-acyltransferase / dihydroxyacetone phosphate acyltransferase